MNRWGLNKSPAPTLLRPSRTLRAAFFAPFAVNGCQHTIPSKHLKIQNTEIAKHAKEIQHKERKVKPSSSHLSMLESNDIATVFSDIQY